MLGDSRLAVEFADDLFQKGIYVIGVTFPGVPKGEAWVWLGVGLQCVVCAGLARIRVQMSAVHSPEEVERCAKAFIEVGKAKGVIS